MVFVKDDNGGIAGLITIEDLLEEIVGEIYDEDQVEEQECTPQGNNIFSVSGNMGLDKLNDILKLELEDEDCQTIGGLITKAMGRFPKKDEKVDFSGLVATVLDVDDRKINRLLVEKKAGEGEGESRPELPREESVALLDVLIPVIVCLPF